jgi:hypothetical protein
MSKMSIKSWIRLNWSEFKFYSLLKRTNLSVKKNTVPLIYYMEVSLYYISFKLPEVDELELLAFFRWSFLFPSEILCVGSKQASRGVYPLSFLPADS